MFKPFLLPAFLLLAFPLSGQDSLFLLEATRKWDNAVAYTREVASAMPMEHYDFRPTAEEMTFGEQLAHMAGNMGWLAGDFLLGKKFEHPLKDKPDRTPAETMQYLNAALDFARDALAAADPDSLSQTVPFFAGPLTRRQVILLLHDHHTHHRGQLVVYLRLKGIQPPRYRGW